MWQTEGHHQQKAFLDSVLNNRRFSHAYIFSGPSEIGKRTLATEFAQKILNVRSENATVYNPDLIVIGADQLKIADSRKLIADLSLRPYYYEFKVAIIDNFHNCTEEAAHSILKTLEEPSATTIIILIANNHKAILPTILSRAQILHFSRFDGSDSEHAWADGRLGKIMKAKEDLAYHKTVSERNAELLQLKQDNSGQRFVKIKKFAELEAEYLQELFQTWLDREHFSFTHGHPELYKNITLLIEALQGLRQNFNKKLVLEKLFLHIK